jgi:hypothetical protein
MSLLKKISPKQNIQWGKAPEKSGAFLFFIIPLFRNYEGEARSNPLKIYNIDCFTPFAMTSKASLLFRYIKPINK